MKILQQGAEAVIKLDEDKKVIVKERIKKGYRIKEVDEKIRKLRTRREAKLIKKASEVICAPNIILVDESNKRIIMEFINGKKLSDYLDALKNSLKVCEKIGESVAKLHNSDIIHGDLTTSNMILKGGDVFFVDFGLGYHSHRIEDKAVDLHLLKEALEAKHFNKWGDFWKFVLKGYKKISKDYDKIIERLEKVEKRGRYKH